MNGTTQIPAPVNAFYSRTLLERATPFLLHDKWAQIKDLPRNQGDTIKFRKFGALAVNITPLVEGVTPLGKQLSVTDITATVEQYGDFVTLTDFLLLTTFDPVLTEAAEVLGEQAGESLETILVNILAAGTSVQYAGGQVSRGAVAIGHKITNAEVKLVVRTLKNNKARPVTRMVNPDTGYATTPVMPCYVGLVHPNTTYDLKGIAEFKDVSTYARAAGNLLPNEVGKLDEVRFCESTMAKVFTAAGSGGIDVYGTLIMGQNAYGVSRIAGAGLEFIVQPLGSGGTADPLKQRATSGWKATFAAMILQQLFMVRLEHAVTA